MAGAGFKTFNTGDVLTASDVNTYLMQQTVMVFADSSARSTALGANVAEGMISYLKDTNAVERYDGSSWGAIGAGDIEGVTAGTGLTGGGTSGTVTLTSDASTILDAKGDLIVASAADTVARLAVGGDYGFLQALASATNGVKWNIDAWTSWTPTVTAGTGTFTTVSATGKYYRIGKLCAIQEVITITTNGTAAGTVKTDLPFTASANMCVGLGRETGVTGKMLQAEITSTTATWRNYDNTYPGGTGYTLYGFGIYEVA